MATAQSFSNTTGGPIDESTFCAGGTNASGTGVVNDLERSFTVTGLANIADLNIGLLLSHTWRGDLNVRLESPLGTEVQLITPDTSGAGNLDNYNIELSDEAAETVNTGSHNAANNTAATLYEFEVSPDNGLSAFDGQNPNGTWTLKICDDYTGENGTFISSELIFAPTTGADLSLTASTASLFPEIGTTVSFTYELLNSGPETATGVAAQIDIPAGLSYVSDAGAGTYNSATGLWTLPVSLASGSTSDLTITATVNPIGPYSVGGEITAADQADGDSIPNNSSTTEDDDAALAFAPVPSSTPPSLTCPAVDQFALVFDAPGTANGWAAGSLSNSFTANGENFDITLTGDTNRFIARTFGGTSLQTPVTTTQFATGANAGEYSIVMNIDFAATSESITSTMILGNGGAGVGQMQFNMYDIDLGAWTDRIIVSGTFNGNPVSPILTPGGANTISAPDTILGTAGAATGDDAGTAVVTFLSPVDTVIFSYDNASATANPASQVIGMHTLNMCPLQMADLSAVKTVEVYDPAGLGLYMTPGNEVLYKITVTNSDTATAIAEDVDISDTLPTNLKFVSATTTGFIGGAFGTPDLPPANTDCDVTPCIIRYSGGDVPIDTTAEIQVRALIK